ncbi:hypothetical protein HG1285_04458, partial [Hydrogenivirga sp. 128-5-R1-1]
MNNIEKVKNILGKVLKYDDEMLERVKVSEALEELVSKIDLPKSIKEDIKTFDGLSAGKKRAFAKYILSVLSQIKEKQVAEETKEEPFSEDLSINEIEKYQFKFKDFEPVEKELKKIVLKCP